MTVLANGCYRWLGKQLRGYEKADPKTLYRLVVATQGVVRTTREELIVRFENAATTRSSERLPWIGRRPRFPGSAADESGSSSLRPRQAYKINYFSGRGITR